jgi:hypothetical protein
MVLPAGRDITKKGNSVINSTGVFLIFLFALGYLICAINTGFFRRRGASIAYAAAIALSIPVTRNVCERFSLPVLAGFISAPRGVVNCALLQMLESVIILTLSVRYLVDHYWPRGGRRWAALSLAPPMAAFAANVAAQAFLFYALPGVSFTAISWCCAGAFFAVLCAAAIGIRALLPDVSKRMSLKVMLTFLQIALAMFLPVAVNGIDEIPVPVHGDFLFAGVAVLGMASIAGAGFCVHRYNNRERTHSVWRLLHRFCI